MSVLLSKVLWFRESSPNVGINITDSIDMTVGRGLDIKNNILQIKVKNPSVDQDSLSRLKHKFVDNDGNIKFAEQDQIKLYLKYTDDMADVEDSIWAKTNASSPSSDNLKGVYYIIDVDTNQDEKGTPITIKCADKAYILFNKLLARNFDAVEANTSPEIVQKVVRFSSQNQQGVYLGTGEDAGVHYDVDAKLFSEGYVVGTATTTSAATKKLIDTSQNFTSTVTYGDMIRNTTDETYARVTGIDSSTQLSLSRDIMDSGDGYHISNGFIQDTRKDVKEDGSSNGTATFPTITLAKVWKPVYEWIGDLSQMEMINSLNELQGVYVYGAPFVFWIDESNRFHWVQRGTDVDESIIVGDTKGIYNWKMLRSVFDVLNFIIYRGGEDFFGEGTLDYYIDPTTNIGNKKMRVVGMTDIAQNLIREEIAAGNLVGTSTGDFVFSGINYARNGTVTPLWAGTVVTNDTVYNNSLRGEIFNKGRTRAQRLVQKLARARWKGNIERKGGIFTVGDVIEVTNPALGLNKQKVRITDIRDSINKSGWFTTLELEEDPVAIVETL